eukprot:1155599-Pelagomonas_calceolata.AAC.10
MTHVVASSDPIWRSGGSCVYVTLWAVREGCQSGHMHLDTFGNAAVNRNACTTSEAALDTKYSIQYTNTTTTSEK